MINKLNLLWLPNFIALGKYFIFGTKFSWNEGIGTCFNVECVLLGDNFDFLGIYLVVTARYCSFLGGYCSLLLVPWWLLLVIARSLVVTARYCSFLGGYCSLLLVPWWLLLVIARSLVVTACYCSFLGGYCSLLLVTWWLLLVIARSLVVIARYCSSSIRSHF